MNYPDTITVTRATFTGAEDEFGQQTADTPTTLYTGSADVQDKQYGYAVQVSGDADIDAMAEVFVPEETDVLPINIDDDVAVTMGQFGTSRTAKVVALDPLNQSLMLRWT